jgi:GcrA cell cycle regulator
MNRFDWTDEKITELRTLQARGLSASQIAAAMGGELTRCGVIGKLRRLGIKWVKPSTPRITPPRVHKPSPVIDRPITRVEIAAPAPRFVAIPVAAPATPAVPVMLNELRNNHCRWPIGDPRDDGFRFCGALEADLALDRPYCDCHARLARGELRQRVRLPSSSDRRSNTSRILDTDMVAA